MSSPGDHRAPVQPSHLPRLRLHRTAADEVCPKCAGEMYQRDDDKPETIANRLDVYEKNTSPLVEYYRGQGRLDVVNGVGTIAEVHERVKEALGL